MVYTIALANLQDYAFHRTVTTTELHGCATCQPTFKDYLFTNDNYAPPWIFNQLHDKIQNSICLSVHLLSYQSQILTMPDEDQIKIRSGILK